MQHLAAKQNPKKEDLFSLDSFCRHNLQSTQQRRIKTSAGNQFNLNTHLCVKSLAFPAKTLLVSKTFDPRIGSGLISQTAQRQRLSCIVIPRRICS
ncbi:hypothetical protein EUTSA_v10009194mg [Eutrema salsugineum]|uniref:Uncharacterized protein n=1 Tax=Eutrema salsugineum TaxID=72664 RepID=V4L923_EUTSA|nr:hypothetical protein EUTSA_v10009194mg [Eutrema salsugineum]